MTQTDTGSVCRWDQHGRRHVVRVRRTGTQRTLRCETCDWRTTARFLPGLKAEEHLLRAHQATVDPAGGPSASRPATPGSAVRAAAGPQRT